jgi:hypothetical protein
MVENEGKWEQPSLFHIDDLPNTDVATHWFFGDASSFDLPGWLPTEFDEFCLRSMNIDPL